MGRCLSPCLQDLDPDLYRERLEAALRCFTDAQDGGRALLDHVEAQMRAAAAERRYEAAAALRRRRDRLETLVGRLGGVLRAVHAGARLVVAPHPATRGRADALWIAGGRVVDWARLPEARPEVAARTTEALRGALPPGSLGGWLPPDELGEVRLVGGWLAGNAARVLELQPAPSAGRIEAFVDAALA
jgi:DNA polymerase-3 subunit epsilon